MTHAELLAQIEERIEELKQDWEDEPDKNNNHMASMIIGEIDGLNWVKAIITGGPI